MKAPSSFIAITSEGGLLPADFLHELPDPKTSSISVTVTNVEMAMRNGILDLDVHDFLDDQEPEGL